MRLLSGAANVLQDNLPWIIPSAIGVLILIGIAVMLMRMIAHRRHDRALAEEAKADAMREAPSARNAAISIIPPEALPQDENRIFMPVPRTVSDMIDFVREKRDRIIVRSCVPAEDADRLLTDAQAIELKRVIYRGGVRTDAMAYVTVDVLSANFAPYSYVNLEILKRHGFVDETVTALSVRADGVLRKPLMVEAQEFSLTAIKMISLVGGRAVEARASDKGM